MQHMRCPALSRCRSGRPSHARSRKQSTLLEEHRFWRLFVGSQQRFQELLGQGERTGVGLAKGLRRALGETNVLGPAGFADFIQSRN